MAYRLLIFNLIFVNADWWKLPVVGISLYTKDGAAALRTNCREYHLIIIIIIKGLEVRYNEC